MKKQGQITPLTVTPTTQSHAKGFYDNFFFDSFIHSVS